MYIDMCVCVRVCVSMTKWLYKTIQASCFPVIAGPRSCRGLSRTQTLVRAGGKDNSTVPFELQRLWTSSNASVLGGSKAWRWCTAGRKPRSTSCAWLGFRGKALSQTTFRVTVDKGHQVVTHQCLHSTETVMSACQLQFIMEVPCGSKACLTLEPSSAFNPFWCVLSIDRDTSAIVEWPEWLKRNPQASTLNLKRRATLIPIGGTH